MIERLVAAGDGWLVRVRCSQISDGDFRCYRGQASPGRGGALERRRQTLMSGRWTWLRQVHGADVVVVTEPGGCAGAVADGAVTAVPEAVLALHTADCAPVVVVGDGALGMAHAGWRGIVAGVIGGVVDGVRRQRRHVEGAGEFVADGAQQRHGADVRGAGGAEDRRQRAAADRGRQPALDLFVGQLQVLQVLERQIVVRLRDALRQPLARLLDGVR